MTPPRLLRPLAAAVALAAVAGLAGCGNKAEPTKAADKDKGKTDPNPGGGPGGTGPGGITVGTNPPPPGAVPVKPTDPVQDAAAGFLRDLGQGAVKADRLTADFLKVVGKPVAFESEKAKGYSDDEAVKWLQRVSGGLTFGIPTGYSGPGVAVFTGTFQSPNRKDPTRYRLRMVQEGPNWKTDWFQVAAGDAAPPRNPLSADEPFQDFAVGALLDAITDRGAMRPEDRAPLLAAVAAAPLREKWAPPFNQDKAQGYDYNPAEMTKRVNDLARDAENYSRTPTDSGPNFKGELTFKGGAKKGFHARVGKGPGPGVWVVEEFAVQ